ncbi:ejaculatory bulb-specific protein 3-like [Maniola hyperantus]|uniref:ejaculatory bulb-specific protein 3-like n=1 Tax=Aphantopus hyperantus TaxID=2795564 RepID=UPI0037494BAE
MMINMLSRIFISALAISLVAAEFYSSRYDDFDIKPLLENDRILLGYTKCFLEQGPCTAEAKDFKKAIPEAVETTCGKCTPKQKQLIRKVIKAVMIKHPTAWQQLVDKYDKDNTYRDTFNAFIEEIETIEH